MKNKYKLIILLISIFFSNPLISQIFDTTYQDEKIKLKGVLPDDYFNYIRIVGDYDNRENIIMLQKKNNSLTFTVNDTLGLIDTLSLTYNNAPVFKYNNKLWGVTYTPKFNSGGSFIGFDSIYLKYVDLNDSNKLTTLVLPDSIVEGYEVVLLFTKENEFALLSLPPLSEADINQNLDRFRISIVDTLGNVVNSKVHYNKIRGVHSFAEHDNKFVFSKYQHIPPDYHQPVKTYFIDKVSLDIVDSILIFNAAMKSVNDSILIGLTGCTDLYLYVINTNTKTIDTITYNVGEIYECMSSETAKFDYLRTDSIYLCYEVSSYDGSGFIEILNFGLGREINFKYRFDDFMYQAPKQITGVKATDDGGVIFTVYLHNYYDRGVNYSSQSWLVKFMPNGLSELTNIETNEKASIKVYPNPAKDYIYVDIEADRFSSSEIELFDIQGRLVKKSKLNAQIGNRIDVSSLNPGAYTYRVVINGKGISGKVIIGE
ncbi:MAG: T9SS type A sorting domain-containing protein [Bacteroidales bacterium]